MSRQPIQKVRKLIESCTSEKQVIRTVEEHGMTEWSDADLMDVFAEPLNPPLGTAARIVVRESRVSGLDLISLDRLATHVVAAVRPVRIRQGLDFWPDFYVTDALTTRERVELLALLISLSQSDAERILLTSVAVEELYDAGEAELIYAECAHNKDVARAVELYELSTAERLFEPVGLLPLPDRLAMIVRRVLASDAHLSELLRQGVASIEVGLPWRESKDDDVRGAVVEMRFHPSVDLNDWYLSVADSLQTGVVTAHGSQPVGGWLNNVDSMLVWIDADEKAVAAVQPARNEDA